MLWLTALVLSTTLALPRVTNAAVGKVTEQTGPTEIVRNKKSVASSVNSPVEMNDAIVTAKSRAMLTFDDATTVKITEQSKLVIDDFVYDPNKGTGKLALKVVLGTARYASGQIAKTNPQSVNVQTPTATIAVRGTDFSMTVDELGRSLIVLLPSCDRKGCVTGAIMVSNDVGSVLLDVAYQATLVSSLTAPPTTPAIINIDTENINNMLILSPPVKTKDQEIQSTKNNELDIDLLGQDFLKYSALDEDALGKFKELDLNMLDNNFLVNLLDLSSAQLAASQEQMSAMNKLLPGYAEVTGIRYFFSDDESKINVTRILNHVAVVTLGIEQDAVISFTQDGLFVTQKVNQGGNTVINIVQK